MVNQTIAPERKDIITWLQGLDAGADHYDNYMMGLQALNPRFTELDKALEGTGGLKQEIEKSMRDPKFLDLLINSSQDNGQFEKILDLTNSQQGQKLLTLSLGAINGNIVAGSSVLASTDEQYSLLKGLGLVEKAQAAGLHIEENPIKTPSDALLLLSTVFAPMSSIAPARTAFAATAVKALTPKAAKVATTIPQIPLKTAKVTTNAAKAPLTTTTAVAAKTIPYIAPKAGKALKTAAKNPVKTTAGLVAADVALNEGDVTQRVAGKGMDWAAEATIGKENYETLKDLYNKGLPDMPDMITDNSSALLATTGIAAAAYLAYNIGSSALSMAFTVGKYALGAAAVGYAGNFLYQNLLSPSSPLA